jgi:hypothetical protein
MTMTSSARTAVDQPDDRSKGNTCQMRMAVACWARIFDRRGDVLLLVAAWTCHAAIWYSWVTPPRTCFRRIRCSARFISGGRVGA